jgi:hypothetical protein
MQPRIRPIAGHRVTVATPLLTPATPEVPDLTEQVLVGPTRVTLGTCQRQSGQGVTGHSSLPITRGCSVHVSRPRRNPRALPG